MPIDHAYLSRLGAAIGEATAPGVSLSWEYPGIVSIHPAALPDCYVFATPGYEADEAELASGTVHVPVQWGRYDGGGYGAEVPDLSLRVSGDLPTDVAAYLGLVPAIVAAVLAAARR